ncbi:MAG: hypothetical protein FWG08_06480 [Propionibacteriaceae bacterium]|nr:hypothetical protein [Propionibacteriaceae bacterium]
MRKASHWFVVLSLVLVGSLSACGVLFNPPPDPSKAGSLKSFSYDYGSFNGGYWAFQIQLGQNPEDPMGDLIYIFSARGSNGVELDVNKPVPGTVLDDIEQIMADHNIYSWDGFNKSDKAILDGYSFGLVAEFDNSTVVASGYMKYPKNYHEGHQALATYLNALAE